MDLQCWNRVAGQIGTVGQPRRLTNGSGGNWLSHWWIKIEMLVELNNDNNPQVWVDDKGECNSWKICIHIYMFAQINLNKKPLRFRTKNQQHLWNTVFRSLPLPLSIVTSRRRHYVSDGHSFDDFIIEVTTGPHWIFLSMSACMEIIKPKFAKAPWSSLSLNPAFCRRKLTPQETA